MRRDRRRLVAMVWEVAAAVGQANRIWSLAKQEGSPGEGSCHFSLDTVAWMRPQLGWRLPLHSYQETKSRTAAEIYCVTVHVYDFASMCFVRICHFNVTCSTHPTPRLYILHVTSLFLYKFAFVFLLCGVAGEGLFLEASTGLVGSKHPIHFFFFFAQTVLGVWHLERLQGLDEHETLLVESTWQKKRSCIRNCGCLISKSKCANLFT